MNPFERDVYQTDFWAVSLYCMNSSKFLYFTLSKILVAFSSKFFPVLTFAKICVVCKPFTSIKSMLLYVFILFLVSFYITNKGELCETFHNVNTYS